MHLKSLTLRGFKSFASATTLTFEPGITCVVGPNGSGKSNVVDALSWVMGEQGAKTLRGGKMEDVIFAGTAGRAPLGRAEVVLTIDNTDGALPIDYAEVTIARTMFRNGGSEYAINGTTARLLDVQDLLSDSGIGREMHVIVGQGQLDSILQATPEGRRGFIEEAAGVLKHRKRKEKALRKLEACEGNLNRLADLITEIRRQLKPLGRQAEVARKAAVVQAEARDARARLLADDLVQATLALESELADEALLRQRRSQVEAALDAARQAELEAEELLRASAPRVAAAQEIWYALAGLRERVSTTASIARERMRLTETDTGELRTGRDPGQLESEAEAAAAAERELTAELAARTAALTEATGRRVEAEEAHQAEDRRLADLVRAAADRREGLARLIGQVNSLRSRAEAAEAEIGRLAAASEQAGQRADSATRAFAGLETQVAGLDAGELGLDARHESAVAELEAVDAALAELRRDELEANQQRAALSARVEALELGLDREDASAALLGAEDRPGLLGSVASLVRVRPTYETAVAAALGSAADAVAVRDLNAALDAFAHLKADDLGRAHLLVGGPLDVADRSGWPRLPDGTVYALEVAEAPAELAAAVAGPCTGSRSWRIWPPPRSCCGAGPTWWRSPATVTCSAPTRVPAGRRPSPAGSRSRPPWTTLGRGWSRPGTPASGCDSRPASWPSGVGRRRARSRWPWPSCTSRTRPWPRWPRSWVSSARPPGRPEPRRTGCGRASPRPKPPATATSPGWPSWRAASPGPRRRPPTSTRTRRCGTAWPPRRVRRGRPRWRPAWRSARSRSGPAGWPVGPTPCGARRLTNGRSAPRRRPAGTGGGSRPSRPRRCTGAPATWPLGWSSRWPRPPRSGPRRRRPGRAPMPAWPRRGRPYGRWPPTTSRC